MADTNGHNGDQNGKPLDRWTKFGPEVGAFWCAEGISAVTLPGAVWLMEKLPSGITDTVSKVIGKCLQPVIEPLEKGLSFVCRLDVCKPDLTKSREERAERFARTLLIATPPLAFTWWAKLNMRRTLEKKWGVPGTQHKKVNWWNPLPKSGKEWMVTLTDEGAHTLFMGMVGGPYADQANKAIKRVEETLVKWGMSPKAAKSVAVALVFHEGPNIAAGGTATLGLALRRYFHGPNGIEHK